MERSRIALVVEFHRLAYIKAAEFRLNRSWRTVQERGQIEPEEIDNVFASADWICSKTPVVDTLIWRYASLLGPYIRNLGYWQELLRWLEASKQVLERDQQMAELAVVENNLGDLQRLFGSYDLALQSYGRARTIQQQLHDDAGLAITAHNLAATMDARGDYAQALAYEREAIEGFALQGKTDRVLLGLTSTAAILVALGSFDAALNCYMRALELTPKVPDTSIRAQIYNNLGQVLVDRGVMDRALTFYDKARVLYEDRQDQNGMATVYGNMGSAYAAIRQEDAALLWFDKARRIEERIQDRLGLTSTLNNIGLLYKAKGDLPTARHWLEAALDLCNTLGNPKDLAIAYENLGSLTFAEGSHRQALENFERAREILDTVGRPTERATTYNNIGQVHAALGSPKIALQWYSRGIELTDDVQSPRLRADLLANRGHLLCTTGELIPGKVALVDALQLYRQIGAQDRIDSILQFFAKQKTLTPE